MELDLLSGIRSPLDLKAIPIDELKYWSVSRQEAYVDAAASMKRVKETGEA